MPNKIMPLADAIARNVRDGQTISMEGFTHLIPFAAGHEVIRQGRSGLKLVRMTPDIIYDQLSLAKKDYTPQEILLRQFQRGSTYSYSFSAGVVNRSPPATTRRVIPYAPGQPG